MRHDLELWKFISNELQHERDVVLLVVAASTGSSPGRAGYKMAVSSSGDLFGSIGGGVMEVALVEQAKAALASTLVDGGSLATRLVEQVHRKDAPNASGMICSGRQEVIMRRLTSGDVDTVNAILSSTRARSTSFEISDRKFQIVGSRPGDKRIAFTKISPDEFVYRESAIARDHLYIIGGGHCALALSEVMARLDFRISILDDRPALNTMAKNEFADELSVIDGYDSLADLIPSGEDVYVAVMTLGYASDAVVIRQLIDHRLKYLGVLGSKAKMAVLINELKADGYDADKLSAIRTPIGLQINSQTPYEIAVSIAAEIISIRNS